MFLFSVLAMDNIPLWVAFSGSFLLGILVATAVRVFLVPYYQRRLTPQVNFTLGLSNGNLRNILLSFITFFDFFTLLGIYFTLNN